MDSAGDLGHEVMLMESTTSRSSNMTMEELEEMISKLEKELNFYKPMFLR